MDTLNNSKSRYKTILIFCLLAMLFVVILHMEAVYASESSDIAILKKLRLYGIDSTSNIGIDMLRTIGYSLVTGLGNMIDGLYGAIGVIYKYVSFTTSDQLMALVTRYSVLYKAVFIVSLTFFGIYIIHSKNALNQLNTVNCILLIIFVIAAMPLFTQKMADFTISSTDYVKGQWVKTAEKAEVDSIASTILTTNIVDLKKVDNNISGSTVTGLKKDKAFNNLKTGSDDWKLIDINTDMDYDEDKFKNDVWSSKLQMEESGKYELVGLDDGLINSYYYRYQIISWFNIFAELISAAIVLFFVCFKSATLIFDIAMGVVYIPFVAITDITTGQRIKEALKNFIVLYATIFLCIALLGVYFAAFSFINENVNQTFPKIIMHIALAWVTMGGPNVLERITGVDVGSKGAWQKIMGARALFGIAVGAGRIASKTASAAGKVGRAAGNVFVGKERIDNTLDKMKEAKNSAVHTATDGKGLLGFGKNAAEGMREKMTPPDSTKGVENIAFKAETDIGRNMGENTAIGGMREKTSEHSNISRPDRKKDNLNSNIKRPSSPQRAAAGSTVKQINRGVKQPTPSHRDMSGGGVRKQVNRDKVRTVSGGMNKVKRNGENSLPGKKKK